MRILNLSAAATLLVLPAIPVQASQNSFNPAISLVLDGHYASYDKPAGNYTLPGFMLGEEAGLDDEGFAIGESELIASANIDSQFYGKLTLAIADSAGASELGIEEAYVDALGIGNGVSLRFGRFFSAFGYLNEQHAHAWDFADAPLVYRAMFGDQLKDDGIQLVYLAPTDLFLSIGAELLSGKQYPAGGDQQGAGAWTAFINVGDDIGVAHSWLLGLNHWQADVKQRTAGEIDFAGNLATPAFSGNSKINAIDFVYKWAPNGNPKNENFKFQFEYFDRRENGDLSLIDSVPLALSSYAGDQSGWYAQTLYQFASQWRTGLRFDQLNSDNTASDSSVLASANLDNLGHTPKRQSLMLEWLPSEFSRLRLQLNRDASTPQTDNQLLLQYTMSLGSHGAHAY